MIIQKNNRRISKNNSKKTGMWDSLHHSKTAKWGMSMARSALGLCIMIAEHEECRKAFMSEVNLGSFVQGLNYTLDSLVTGVKLKINNPAEYFFEPKKITEELVFCYAFMGNYQDFIDCVVLDARSYKERNFEKVIRLMNKAKIMVPMDKAKEFQDFFTKCKESLEENQLKETFMDDAPEEFMDQLFCVLMEDPVRLPSGNVTDLTQLKKHLLNDPTDPYTRAPMKLEDVEPLPELKAKILEFRDQKLEEFRQEKERRKKQADEEEGEEIEGFD